MLVTPINDTQSFRARIKMDKSNIKNLASKAFAGTVAAGSGASAAASLGAQTDFDLALSQSSIKSFDYQPTIMPLIDKSNNHGTPFAESSGEALSAALSVQGSGLLGSKMLDVTSNGALSKTIDNIDIKKNEGLIISNLAASLPLSYMLPKPLDVENLATYATTAVPLSTANSSAIAEAYDKSQSNKKIPS